MTELDRSHVEAATLKGEHVIGGTRGDEPGLFDQSLAASILLGIVLGLAMIITGLAMEFNARGYADRYTTFLIRVWPFHGKDKRSTYVGDRVVFGVIAAFGVAFFVGGIVSVVQHSR